MSAIHIGHQSSFPVELLREIAKACDRHTSLALARVSRALRSIAHEELLADVSLDRDNEQILQFLRFMLKDLGIKAPWLKSLRIARCKGSMKKVPFGGLLSQVLLQARNLRRIELWSAEPVIASDSNLGPALAGLPKLAEVLLYGVDTLAVDRLQNLRNITQLSVLFVGDLNVSAMMDGSRMTLESIKLQMSPETHVPWSFVLAGTWPFVRTVELFTENYLPLEKLMAAFPNARQVHLTGYRSALPPDVVPNAIARAGENRWSSLDYLAVDVFELMRWDCDFPIRQIALADQTDFLPNDWDPEPLYAALDRFRPAALSMKFPYWPEMPTFFEDMGSHVPRLAAFRLHNVPAKVKDINELVAEISGMAPWPSLKFLQIEVYIEDNGVGWAEGTLRRHRSYATQVFQTLPRLEYFFILDSGCDRLFQKVEAGASHRIFEVKKKEVMREVQTRYISLEHPWFY